MSEYNLLVTVQHAQQFGRAELVDSPTPDIDAQVLLCHLLACRPTQLMMAPETELTVEQWQCYKAWVARRKKGEPVAHITESRGFWSLDLAVNASTLIPRPDTELLVSLALAKLRKGMCVADLGTGSGAIALSLAAEMPDLKVIATDLHHQALKLAQHNSQRHEFNHVSLVQMSWLNGFTSQVFDFIVSNPPYIELNDPHLTEGDVRYEPLTALVSGEDGLADIRQIVVQATRCLKPEGWLLVEHGYDQSARVQALFADAGFDNISAHQDFGGQDRAVMGQLTL